MPRQSARWGRRYPFLVAFACLLALTPVMIGAFNHPAAVSAASNLPNGFYEEKVTTVTPYQTTAFAFLPDGRILLTEKPGYIRVYKNGALLDTPMLNITDRVNQSTDRGLLGITIDPNFANGSPYVYLAYTYDPVMDPYKRNNDARKTAHVSRFTVVGDSADPASEVILLGKVTPPSGSCNDAPVGSNCLPSDGLSHTVDTIKFAPDGSLFVSIGESGDYTQVNSDALRAQNIDSLAGKVLRVNADGTGRPGNPFWNGDPNAARSRVWAYGFRNPFRFNLRPGTDIPYLGDVGWGLYEELNVILPGQNYGWPCYEGTERQPNYSSQGACQQLYNQGGGAVHQPLVTWDHPDGTGSVVGGAFYTGTNYPAQYRGRFFYGDYSQGFIRSLSVDGNQNLVPGSVADFGTNVAGPVDIEMGPDGNLYYVSIVTGDLYRIIYGTSATPKPQTTGYLSDMQWTSMNNGLGPVELDRSNGGQAQGDGGPLRVGGIEYAKGLGMYAPAQVTYALGSGCDVFTAQVGIDDRLVQDGGSVEFQVWSGNDLLYNSYTVYYTEQPHTISVNVSGRSELRLVATTAGDDQYGDYADWLNARCDPQGAPVVTIDAPTARTYRIGDAVSYGGSAVDPNGGPAPTLAWQLITRHCPGGTACHAHPATLPGGSGTFIVNDHDDFTHLELILTATSSSGVATTQTVAMYPQQALLTADTAPAGLNMVYGSQNAAPTVMQQIDIGGTRSLSAVTPQTLNGVTYAFTGWSDGNTSAQRTVTMTEGGMNLSALYAPVAASGATPLTIGIAGSGDVQRANGGGAGSFPYPTGSGVVVRPVPAAGSLFVGWTVDGRSVGSASPLSVTMDAPHTLVATFAPSQTFRDATPDKTGATGAIAQLAARGVIKGCDPAAGLFCPTDPTLRAQMAVLIVRAMGWGGENPANPFSDRSGVDDELWRAIAIMAAHKVANGYGDGTFGTTNPVLNAQVISFITRAMVSQGYWQLQSDNPQVYSNVPATSGHRQDLVTYAYYAGSIRGTAGTAANFVGWDAPASRAWFAYTFWQALSSYFGVDRPGVGGYVP